MPDPGWCLSVRAFVEDYSARVRDQDLERIADAYVLPSTVVRADGSRHAFANRGEILAYLGRRGAEHRAAGVRSAYVREVSASPLGTHAAIATVVWQVVGVVGDPTGWRTQSLVLLAETAGWRIVTSVVHRIGSANQS
jgi:hypothetical protein